MAYQQDFTDKDKENLAESGQVLTSSGPSTIGAPASGADTSSAPTTPKKGSGFTNLSQYTKANEDQAYNKLVPTITSGLRQQLGSVQTAKNDFWNTIASKAKENTIQDQGLNTALRADPEAANAEQWKSAYGRQTGGYAGPKDVSEIQGYQELNKDISNLNTDIQGLREPGRLQTRLQDTFGKNTPYTRGQNILDSYITTTGAGAEALGQFQNEYAGQNLPKSWEDLKAGGNTAFSQAADITNKTKADTEDALKAGIQAKKDREAEEAKRLAARQDVEMKQAAPVVAPVAPVAPPPEQPAKEIPKALPDIKKGSFAPPPILIDTQDLRNALGIPAAPTKLYTPDDRADPGQGPLIDTRDPNNILSSGDVPVVVPEEKDPLKTLYNPYKFWY